MTSLSGQVDLALPRDLFDVMAPADEQAAREVLARTIGELLPKAAVEDRAAIVDGLLSWRRSLFDQGVILHGLVAIPAEEAEKVSGTGPAHWHFFAGVVDVPAAGELDAGTVLARYLGQAYDADSAYAESFDTEMGWGVGLITSVPLTPPDPGLASAAALPTRMGLSAALSAPREGTTGLLVVGLCLDLERTLDMAAIVATIAGNSIIRHDSEAPLR